MKKANKLTALVGAGLITLSSLVSGCSYVSPIPRAPMESKKEEAMRVLGLNKIEQVVDLKNGYFSSKSPAGLLDHLSRVYSGDFEIRKTNGSSYVVTNRDNPRDPKAFDKICQMADTYEDNIITLKESNDLADKIGKEYAKK